MSNLAKYELTLTSQTPIPLPVCCLHGPTHSEADDNSGEDGTDLICHDYEVKFPDISNELRTRIGNQKQPDLDRWKKTMIGEKSDDDEVYEILIRSKDLGELSDLGVNAMVCFPFPF
jgi:hypothetical protein